MNKKSPTEQREKERKAQVIALWLKRPVGKRTENDVIPFCMELQRTNEHLLRGPRPLSYPCNQLCVDLLGFIEQ
jgi:hypothetical protein